MNRAPLVILAFLLVGLEAVSQPIQFRVPISSAINARRDTIYFGVSGDGPGGTITDNTYGVDDTPTVGEYGRYREVLTPPDPPQVFLRMKIFDIPGRNQMSTGLRPWDYRGFTSLGQIDTFAFRVYGDAVLDSGVTVSWSPALLGLHGDAWTLKPRTGTPFPETNMLTSSSITLAPTGGPFNFLIIKNGLRSSVEQLGSGIPEKFALEQNFPNPFNPVTEIRFAVPAHGPVSLKVVDLTGKEVARLVDQDMVPGTYSTRFDASGISSGVYFYSLEAGSVSLTRKLVVLK